MLRPFFLALITTAYLCAPGSTIALAETTTKAPNLMIELNNLTQQEQSCQVSFVMKNNLNEALELLTLELVLFNNNQQVQSLLLLKSENMPNNKTSVRQYALEGVKCNEIGQFLINDVKECRGGALTPALCLNALKLNSRTSAKLEN